MFGTIHNEEQQRLVRQAVDKGIDRYIQSRRDKVTSFVSRHFSLRGAMRLHRKALGKDLYKAPLNVLWLAPWSMAKVSSWLLDKAGASKLAHYFASLPPGFETNVQKEIKWLIYTELLELPYQQDDRTSTKDALLASILSDGDLAEVINDWLHEIEQKSTAPDFRHNLETHLQRYASSRVAAAELAGNIITLSSSYIALQKALPGVLSSGGAVATAIAQNIAIEKFWLGSTIGAWYYGLFPVAASTGLVIAATGAVMAGLALVTTFTGIVTDPLQAKLGLHQKRLHHFIDVLGNELSGKTAAHYRLKELYVARVFDVVDLLMTALRC